MHILTTEAVHMGENPSTMTEIMSDSMRNSMKRVIVIGCPGSGKTTFAEKLRDVIGLPLF